MTTVGFIGLGRMGAPMAANLMKAGFSVVAHDPARQIAGAEVADGPGAVARASDIVISMILNDAIPVSYTHLDVYKRQVLDPHRAALPGVEIRLRAGDAAS